MKYLIDFVVSSAQWNRKASMEKACATNADMLIAKKKEVVFSYKCLNFSTKLHHFSDS